VFPETSGGLVHSYDPEGDPLAMRGRQRARVERPTPRQSSRLFDGSGILGASGEKDVLRVGGCGCSLSLGLTYNNLSEMCSHYDLHVERDQKGDAFHHYLDHLLECAVKDEEVVSRACVVKTCRCPHCPECRGFASMFGKEHMSNIVALANRSYFYERVERGICNNFRRL